MAAGILNTGGNGGGLIAPVLTPFLSGIFGWQAGLGLAGVVCLLGAACWGFIDPHDRLEEDKITTGDTGSTGRKTDVTAENAESGLSEGITEL